MLPQFEDLSYDNASKLLNMYRSEFPCFNDDVSGAAAAVLAGVMAGLRAGGGGEGRPGGRLAEQRFVFVGEGAAPARWGTAREGAEGAGAAD